MISYEDGFYTELDDSRICTVSGRLGAGKTLLALTLAERYLRRGYRLVTNVASVWAEDWENVRELPDFARRAVVLIDEGGLYIRSMKTVSALAAFARKLDTYIIIAGRREPHEELCELIVTPRFDFKRNFLIPAWLWRWENRGARRPYGGYMLELGRSGYYGTYDTVNPGARPSALIALVEDWAKALFDHYGYEYGLSDVAQGGGDGAALDAIDAFGVSAQRIRDAVSVLAESRGRRRR